MNKISIKTKFLGYLYWYLENITQSTFFKNKRTDLHLKVKNSFKNFPDRELKTVDRVKNITKEDFIKKYYKKMTPVIIESSTEDWGFYEKWDLDFFRERYKEHKVPIVKNSDTYSDNFQAMTFKEIIDSFDHSTENYAKFTQTLYHIPELLNDFKTSFFDKLRPLFSFKTSAQFFMGPKNSSTRMHCAPGHVFFVETYGDKTWYIYPNKYDFLFNPPTLGTPHFLSDEYFSRPFDNGAYKKLDGWKAELKKGDILYNPSFLWHYVENPTHSIGVKFAWISPRTFTNSFTLVSMILTSFKLNPINLFRKIKKGKITPNTKDFWK